MRRLRVVKISGFGFLQILLFFDLICFIAALWYKFYVTEAIVRRMWYKCYVT
jgi:hypothetical protein